MIVGTAIMLIFSMLVLTEAQEQLSANAANIPPEFFWSVIIFSTLMVLFFYTTAFTMPVEPKREIKTSLIKDFKNLLKDHNFIHFTILVGLASFAWSITQQYLLPLTDVILGLDFIGYAILALLMVTVLIISISSWRRSVGKFGKTRTLLWIFLFSAAALPFALVPMIPLPSPFVFGLIFIPAVAVGLGGWSLYPFIIYADLAENDEKQGSGVMKAGLYAGFPFLPMNIFQAIGLFIAGLLLELPTYAFQIGQESIGYVIWGPICAIALLGSYFYTKRFIQLDFEWEKKERK
jgi:Na+/melibiose symporter-like transporter